MSETETRDVERQVEASYPMEDPVLSEQAKVIFEKYSGIPVEEQVAHVKDIREKGWKIFHYPCIGRYRFIAFDIGDHALYPEVLQKLKDGATLLDLACCFGQDIRKLVCDGAPRENITGSELQPEFIELGYEMFKDKESLRVEFKIGDFFAPETAGLVDGTFDYVHAASFLHLFSWDEQAEAISKALGLLKRKPGSAMFGKMIASDPPEVVRHPRLRSGEMYKHNKESFERLVKGVEEKLGLSVKTEVVVKDRVGGLLMRFSITLV